MTLHVGSTRSLTNPTRVSASAPSSPSSSVHTTPQTAAAHPSSSPPTGFLAKARAKAKDLQEKHRQWHLRTQEEAYYRVEASLQAHEEALERNYEATVKAHKQAEEDLRKTHAKKPEAVRHELELAEQGQQLAHRHAQEQLQFQLHAFRVRARVQLRELAPQSVAPPQEVASLIPGEVPLADDKNKGASI